MSDTIYRYDFRIGKQTQWVYRLDISSASETPLSANPTIIPIPDFAVKLKTIKYPGYDKYPKGMCGIGNAKLVWDIGYLKPATTTANPYDYAELKSAILKPIKRYTSCGPGGETVTNIKASTIYKFYIQFVGQDETPDLFRSEFIGLQEQPAPGDFDGINKIIEVELVDVNATTIKAVPLLTLHDLLNATDSDFIYSIIECLFISGGHTFCYGHRVKRTEKKIDWFVMTALSTIWTQLDRDAQNLYRLLTRNSSATYSIGKPLMKYFKQNYLFDNLKGAELTFDELYVNGGLLIDEDPYPQTNYVSGLLSNQTDKSLQNKFKNGFWDLLTEWYKDSFRKGIMTPDLGLLSYAMFESVDTQIIVKDERIKEFKAIKPGQDVLVTSIASIYEHNDKDVAKREAAVPGSINENPEQTPILLNNAPATCGYSEEKDVNISAFFNITWAEGTIMVDSEYKQHQYGLYYMEVPPNPVNPTLEIPFRVHDVVDAYLGDGLYLHDLPNYNAETDSPFILIPTKQPHIAFLLMQKYSCKPYYLANGLLEIFKSDNQCKIELKVPFYLYTEFLGGGSIGFPWGYKGFMTKFIFDPTILDEYYDELPTNYYMLSSELNFEEECATIELIGRTI